MTTTIILEDVSGSMLVFGKSPQNAINNLIESLTKGDKVVIISFNTKIIKTETFDITDGSKPRYVSPTPDNGTALYDAIIKVVNEYGSDVNFQILTDGEDINSEHSNHDAIAALQKAKAKGWLVGFLAANSDVASSGKDLGIATIINFNNDTDTMTKCMRSLSGAMKRSRTGEYELFNNPFDSLIYSKPNVSNNPFDNPFYSLIDMKPTVYNNTFDSLFDNKSLKLY